MQRSSMIASLLKSDIWMSRLLGFMNTTSVLSSNSFMFILPYRKLIWIQNHMEVNNSLICTFHSLVINFILHHHLNIINFFSWINIMLLQTEHLKDKFFCFHSIFFNLSEWHFHFEADNILFLDMGGEIIFDYVIWLPSYFQY